MRYLIKLPANTQGLYAEGSGQNWKVSPVTGAGDFDNATIRKIRKGEVVPSGDKEVVIYGEPYAVSGKGIAVSRIDGIAVTALQVLSGGDERGVLGYIVAQPDGSVKKYKTDDLLSFCGARTRQKAHGVTNMIYVPGGAAHLKNYPDHDVGVTVYQVAPKPTVPTAPAAPNSASFKGLRDAAIADDVHQVAEQAPDEKAPSVLDLFNVEQRHELEEGKRNGVDIRVYANPKYSAKRMKYIRLVLEAGKDPALILAVEMDDANALIYAADLKHGRDIMPYYNVAYKSDQAREVRLGYYSGVDISQFNNPKYTPSQMIEARTRLESGLWDNAWGYGDKRGGATLAELDAGTNP